MTTGTTILPPPAGAVRGYRTALLLLGAFFAFRLLYGAQLGLAFDEAYYWQWSRHLDIWYYDQGPGIAYVIRAGTLLFGDIPLGVRFGVLLLGTAASWLSYLTARRWAGPTVALWTLVLLNVAPLLTAGTVLATYDVPQVFFWVAALYALTKTLQEDRPALWYAVGGLVGLGLLCKVTMLLFAPCALVLLLAVPQYRRHLATPHPYLAFALALLFLAPLFVWNASHDWLWWKHTATLGNRTKGAAPFRWFGDFWGGQLLVVGPLLLAQLWAAWSRRFRTPASAFFLSFYLPILLVCAFNSLRSKVEPNWPVPMHLTGLMLVGLVFAEAWTRRTRAARAGIVATVGLSAYVTAAAFFPAVLTMFGPVSSKVGVKLNETYGWEQIAGRVQAAREELATEGRGVFVASVNYRVNSILAFYLPDRPQTKGLYLNSRRDQYWLWTDPRPLVGQDAVLVFDNDDPEAVALARRYFKTVEGPEIVEVLRPGFSGPVKSYRIFRCRNFRGYAPAAHVNGY